MIEPGGKRTSTSSAEPSGKLAKETDRPDAVVLGAVEVDVAAAALRQGQLVAFPTETVYGLGADASSAEAVGRIFEAKGRPRGHPLIVHVASTEGLVRLGRNVSSEALALAERFWPGPLTLIVERGSDVSLEATGGRETVGLRAPDHPVALALLAAFGSGVAGPSANRFGAVSPTTVDHVLSDLGGVVDYVIDGGPCRIGIESTIVDVSGDTVQLLRPGGVPVGDIEAVVGQPVVDGRDGPSRAPGMMASHYAPKVPLKLITAEAVEDELAAAAAAAEGPGSNKTARVGLISPYDHSHDVHWRLPADSVGYGKRLYACLREADQAELDLLLVIPPAEGPTVVAVLDRLRRASSR